ncbi:hypothetical protein MLD52_10260 [Puniceicoccaceae bacterium K14]|nr:hypothetical protein [Puniceicoccaceae bacterium K14]
MKALLNLILLLIFGYTLANGQTSTTGGAVNFSLRTELNEKPLIHGLVVDGTQHVLFRAIGKSLEQFDVDTSIDDPCLNLYDADGNQIAQSIPVALLNPVEFGILEDVTEATGAFSISEDSTEAVLIYPVSGPTTLHAKSISGKIGELLIESYVIPADILEPTLQIGGNNSKQYRTIQKLDSDFPTGTERPFQILESARDGNILKLEVQYISGCNLDEFDLYFSEDFIETNPPQADIYLVDRGHNNDCPNEQLVITDNLIFNIEPLIKNFKEVYPESSIDFQIRLNTRTDGINTYNTTLEYEGPQEITWLEDGFPEGPEDPITINSYNLEGDVLSISTSFGGGCRDHEFKSLADPSKLANDDYTVALYLVHDSKNDPCFANPTETIQFDFSSFTTHPAVVIEQDYTLELYTRINGINELFDTFSTSTD